MSLDQPHTPDSWPISEPLLLTNKISKPIIYVLIHEHPLVCPACCHIPRVLTLQRKETAHVCRSKQVSPLLRKTIVLEESEVQLIVYMNRDLPMQSVWWLLAFSTCCGLSFTSTVLFTWFSLSYQIYKQVAMQDVSQNSLWWMYGTSRDFFLRHFNKSNGFYSLELK